MKCVNTLARIKYEDAEDRAEAAYEEELLRVINEVDWELTPEAVQELITQFEDELDAITKEFFSDYVADYILRNVDTGDLDSKGTEELVAEAFIANLLDYYEDGKIDCCPKTINKFKNYRCKNV